MTRNIPLTFAFLSGLIIGYHAGGQHKVVEVAPITVNHEYPGLELK